MVVAAIENEPHDDEAGLGPYAWSVLMNYERADVLKTIITKLSSILFRKDAMLLVEREEYQASTFLQPSEIFTILIHGYVGYERRGILLKLLRWIRLCLVEDVTSSVIVACMKGDEVPHCLLHPLIDDGSMEAFRRWYRAFYAMKCGVFAKMQERRMMTRDRLEAMIKECTVKATGDERADVPNNLEGDQFYRNYFRHLVEEHTASSDKRFESLLEYHTATKEQRVDLARVAAVVPSVIIVWSYQIDSCITWLKDNIFNCDHLKEMKERTGLADARFTLLLDIDPWINFVEQYVTVPPRVKQEGKRPNTLRLLPKRSKRAHIIFVNVDRDADAAREAYKKLLSCCGGWLSKEVSLFPFWSGPEGMQSEFCMMYRTPSLPFIIGAQPWQLTPQKRAPTRPIIVHIPDPEPIEVVKPYEEQKLTIEKLRAQSATKAWHLLPAEERKRLSSSISSFLERSGAPLYFVAHCDTVHTVWNPYAPSSLKALHMDHSSRVVLRGIVSARDILTIKDDLMTLLSLNDFRFEVQVIEHSAPLEVTLDPVTPRRMVVNLTRTHTCSVCLSIIAVDEVAYYRCLQCKQEKGLLCEACFGVASNHEAHHLLIRIPPLGTRTPLDLLWGPTNVLPLFRFCGVLMTNTSGVHLDVYCNRCRSMIRGIRWKCAVCYQYDLCHACFLKATRDEFQLCVKCNENANAGGPQLARHMRHSMGIHQPLHPMICIPYARDGDNNEFLRPETIKGSILDYLRGHG